MGVSKTSDHIQIKIKMPNPSQEPQASSKAPNEDLKDMDGLCTSKINIESKNLNQGYIKDQWPNPNQYQDAKTQSGASNILQSPKRRLKGHGCSLHFQNQDKDKKSDHGYIKVQWPYPNKIKMPNPTQEPSALSKAQNQGFKDMNVFCTLKINIESKN